MAIGYGKPANLLQVRLIPARRLPDDLGERLDEARRVGPAALRSRLGDRAAVGEMYQGVVDAQDGAPAVEAHPELAVEQAAQGALAGARGPAELGQRRGPGRIGMQKIGDRTQPVVSRLGQM